MYVLVLFFCENNIVTALLPIIRKVAWWDFEHSFSSLMLLLNNNYLQNVLSTPIGKEWDG